MALILNCKHGVVRVNGEPVAGIILLPEGAVIEPMAEARFEVLMAQTIAETVPDAHSGVPPVRAEFPPNLFLTQVETLQGDPQRWLLQTPDGVVEFLYRGSALPLVPAA